MHFPPEKSAVNHVMLRKADQAPPSVGTAATVSKDNRMIAVSNPSQI